MYEYNIIYTSISSSIRRLLNSDSIAALRKPEVLWWPSLVPELVSSMAFLNYYSNDNVIIFMFFIRVENALPKFGAF